MFIDDPDTSAPDTTADPAAAAATVDTTVATPAGPEVIEDSAAGMLQAIKDAEPVAEEVAPAADATTDAAKPDPKEGEPAAQAEPTVDDEIKGLGLKEKAAARFRDLTTQVAELAPIKEQLAAAGIKDLAELPARLARAKDGDDMIAMVMETGANGEQYSMALNALGFITRGINGDVEAAEQAVELLQGQLVELVKITGKPLPGVYDPVADHEDLVAAIEAGDMTRKHAEELAAGRVRKTVQQQVRQVRDQGAQHVQSVEQARVALNALGQQLATADPDYARKAPMLVAARDLIRDKYPPSEWAPRLQAYYATIPAMPAPAAVVPAVPAKPNPGPVRASGPRPTMVPTTDDPLEAMMLGIAAATPA